MKNDKEDFLSKLESMFDRNSKYEVLSTLHQLVSDLKLIAAKKLYLSQP